MAMGGFRQNVVGPPEWECEAMDSMVWVKCATSKECINLLIAAPADKGPVRSWSHYESTVIRIMSLITVR